jgi:hypothetical protein
MMKIQKYSFFVSALIIIAGLLVLPLPPVQATNLPIGTHTTIYLTARVQNKWWYAGNLHCKSATLETVGQTYTGTISTGNWWGLAGNESCFITFASVPTPLALTPARVTITYYTLAGDQLVDAVTADRLQTQQEDYFLQLTWYDDYVVLDDMILKDTSTVPVIQVDPTALPNPPALPPIPQLP